ncbi:MAG: hypothetical protein KJ990_04620 [Proteobacteria bacterium]|nr:hypothetical protein [Pseudomonadota bacterium]MBU1649983.1 hypothetical protein [Pseudomonadota bacterium]
MQSLARIASKISVCISSKNALIAMSSSSTVIISLFSSLQNCLTDLSNSPELKKKPLSTCFEAITHLKALTITILTNLLWLNDRYQRKPGGRPDFSIEQRVRCFLWVGIYEGGNNRFDHFPGF